MNAALASLEEGGPGEETSSNIGSVQKAQMAVLNVGREMQYISTQTKHLVLLLHVTALQKRCREITATDKTTGRRW